LQVWKIVDEDARTYTAELNTNMDNVRTKNDRQDVCVLVFLVSD